MAGFIRVLRRRYLTGPATTMLFRNTRSGRPTSCDRAHLGWTSRVRPRLIDAEGGGWEESEPTETPNQGLLARAGRFVSMKNGALRALR